MQRVMIIGQPGSGKSTLARALGDITMLPVYHMDHIHWMPGWTERPREEKTLLCAEVHAQPQWIFEGGHSATWRERVRRADTLIWLDFPVTMRMWRVFWRTVRSYGRSRPDLPENCPERFDREFWHWIWTTRERQRDRMARFFASAPEEKARHHLTSQRKVETYLFSVKHAMSVGSLGLPHR
ncbi:AAA family ATPase [Paracoccaceae bacterium GXU_MW_L88]